MFSRSSTVSAVVNYFTISYSVKLLSLLMPSILNNIENKKYIVG